MCLRQAQINIFVNYSPLLSIVAGQYAFQSTAMIRARTKVSVYQLTLWICGAAIIWRQDEWCWHWASTIRGVWCCGHCGPTEDRLIRCRARPIGLLVLGEKEARGVAESIGWHQLWLALVGEAIIPTLCSLVVLSWRSTGGIMGGHPGAWRGAGSGFWCRARGHCGCGSRGGGGRVRGRGRDWYIFSCSRGGLSCFFGRPQFFVKWDIPDVDG